jgi:DNA-binding Lrp family transcriptional regulator
VVTAIVLIEAKREMIEETAQQLMGLDGVAEVYSVAGPYDLVAVVRVADNEEMARLLTGSMRLVGIEKTTTLVALRAYAAAGGQGEAELA